MAAQSQQRHAPGLKGRLWVILLYRQLPRVPSVWFDPLAWPRQLKERNPDISTGWATPITGT